MEAGSPRTGIQEGGDGDCAHWIDNRHVIPVNAKIGLGEWYSTPPRRIERFARSCLWVQNAGSCETLHTSMESTVSRIRLGLSGCQGACKYSRRLVDVTNNRLARERPCHILYAASSLK